jgi:hypothetical protein
MTVRQLHIFAGSKLVAFLIGRQSGDSYVIGAYFNRSCIEQLSSEDSRSGGRSQELLSLAALELWHPAFLEGEKGEPQTVPDPSLVATNQR